MLIIVHAFGVWRSLVSRLVRDQEAMGSSPVTPTKKGKYRKMLTFFYLSATFCSYEIVFVIQSFTEYTLTC